jgi:hypothetical protein
MYKRGRKMSEITNQPQYLIKFDDTEVADETMFGAEIANKRFEQISGNWNAHLFVKVASNSRDDACSGSNARLASDYNALAAQRDEGLAREAELQRRLETAEATIKEGVYATDYEALQQRLAEAEKDAARYRFLRDGDRGGLEYWDDEVMACHTEDTLLGKSLDSAVDNAIELMAERVASLGSADGEPTK